MCSPYFLSSALCFFIFLGSQQKAEPQGRESQASHMWERKHSSFFLVLPGLAGCPDSLTFRKPKKHRVAPPYRRHTHCAERAWHPDVPHLLGIQEGGHTCHSPASLSLENTCTHICALLPDGVRGWASWPWAGASETARKDGRETPSPASIMWWTPDWDTLLWGILRYFWNTNVQL